MVTTTTAVPGNDGVRYAGLIWTDGIEPGDASECEAPAGNTCYWIDFDAVADGDGSYASPFWGTETALGWMNGANYQQGTAVGGDYIYLKGTAKPSESTESADGPLRVVKVKRAAQMGTSEKPLVIKSWRGTARAILDAEDSTSAPLESGDGYAMISFVDATVTAGKSIRVQNVLVKSSYCKGINSEGVPNLELFTLEVTDTRGNSTGGCGGIGPNLVGNVVYDHHYNHLLIHDNDRAGSGTVQNRGGISVTTDGTSIEGSSIEVENSLFYNENYAIRHKHNGPTVMNIHDNIIRDSVSALLHRLKYTNFYKNLVYGMSGSDIPVIHIWGEASPLPSEAPYILHVGYNNTFYDYTDAVLGTSEGLKNDWVDIEFYNNIIQDTSETSKAFHVEQYGNYTINLSQIVHDHNWYWISATVQSTFSDIMNTDRSFANTMTYLSDTSSSVTDPSFRNAGSSDFYPLNGLFATSGRNGGYIGALTPEGGGSMMLLGID